MGSIRDIDHAARIKREILECELHLQLHLSPGQQERYKRMLHSKLEELRQLESMQNKREGNG